MDPRCYNQRAWDALVGRQAEFTQPANTGQIAQARLGFWQVYLTPGRPAPRTWFPDLKDMDALCLAAGGGMHGPILAAAEARVTVLDLSPRQLEQDRRVAIQEGLTIRTIEGDMADLSVFPDESFNLIVQPISNLYAPSLAPIWKECHRVLRPDGILMAGFMNPVFYIFDRKPLDERGELVVRHRLPFSDSESLTEEERQDLYEDHWPLEWSHSLEEQIGDQIQAGFTITAFYEDRDERSKLNEYLPIYCATRAVKLLE